MSKSTKKDGYEGCGTGGHREGACKKNQSALEALKEYVESAEGCEMRGTADSGGAARFECWTCSPPLKNAQLSKYAMRPVLADPDAHKAMNHDVRPAEVRR